MSRGPSFSNDTLLSRVAGLLPRQHWRRLTLQGLCLAVLGLLGSTVLAAPAYATQAYPSPMGNRVARIAEFPVPPPATAPFGIAPGPHGDMWFGAGDYVGRVTNRGTVTTYQVPTANALVGWVAQAPDGALWFCERIGNKIGRLDAAGRMQEIPIPTPNAIPQSLVFDRQGQVWFTEFGTSAIGRVNRDRTVTEFPLPHPNSGPLGMTVGPDHALWFTERTGERIGRFELNSHQVTEYTLAAGANPQRITLGADRALWFTEGAAAKVGRITASGQLHEFPLQAGSLPTGITTDRDGTLWLTEYGASKIAHLALSGTVLDEYPTPTADSHPILIAIQPGPATRIWFTETSANQIGRLWDKWRPST